MRYIQGVDIFVKQSLKEMEKKRKKQKLVYIKISIKLILYKGSWLKSCDGINHDINFVETKFSR